MELASGTLMTARISTSPKSAIFSLSGSPIGFSLRAMIASGWMPIERSWLTECCVGLLLNSSLAFTYGTSVRCT